MHELSIADAIVTIACEHAAGRRVASVEVRIGRLRQVVPDALQFAFALVAEGTSVAGARLEVEHVPVRVACARCETLSDAPDFPFACARCGGSEVEVVEGDELLVESLELEEETLAVRGG